MSYIKSKSTKRFTYTVDRNDTAKQAGSNTVTIATNSDTEGYSGAAGTAQLRMTVREAQSLQSFLNENLDLDSTIG